MDQKLLKSHLEKAEKRLFGYCLDGKSLWDVWFHPTVRFLWDPAYDDNNKIWYRERCLLQLTEHETGANMQSVITSLASNDIIEILKADPANLKNAYYYILTQAWSKNESTEADLRFSLDFAFKHDFEDHPQDPLLLCLYGGYQRLLIAKKARLLSCLPSKDDASGFQSLVLPKDYRFPLDYYEEALALDPENSVILGLVGYELGYHLNHDRHRESIHFYEKSLDLDPTNKYVLFFKAQWHNEQKEWESEFGCHLRIMKIDPDNLAIQKLAAECLLKLKREAEALGYYEKIISKLREQKLFLGLFPEVLLAPGPVYKRLGQFDQAILYFDDWISKKGVELLFNAPSKWWLRPWKEIEIQLNNILAELLEQKADLLESTNKTAEALEARQRALSLRSLVQQ